MINMTRILYGPLYSRRLGMSLGVDMIPYKYCSYNCIYCHEGETTLLTVERSEFIPRDRVLEALSTLAGQEAVRGRTLDYITLAGSGEPTLDINIGLYIRYLKEHSPVPVAVITNSSLLSEEEVREALLKADLVVPSLDAVTEEAFRSINRPHPGLPLKDVLDGLKEFCRRFEGDVWLEVLLCRGYNDSTAELEKMAAYIEDLEVDKVQLNTVARPPAETFALPAEMETLVAFRERIGERAEIIDDEQTLERESLEMSLRSGMTALLRRRAHTRDELSRVLGRSGHEVVKVLTRMEREGLVERSHVKGRYLYRMKSTQ